MSAQQTSLSSKPVIAVVLCLLAIVAAVNVAVFKPGSARPGRATVRVQASQPVPFDLSELREGTTAPDADLAAWAVSATPTLQRDPFGNPRGATPVPPPVATLDPAPVPKDRLSCNAILLVGTRPAALINGKAYQVGDAVGAYRLEAIGAGGVTLCRAGGQELYLSVSQNPDRVGANRVVTEATRSNGLGGTSLVEHAQGERK